MTTMMFLEVIYQKDESLVQDSVVVLRRGKIMFSFVSMCNGSAFKN